MTAAIIVEGWVKSRSEGSGKSRQIINPKRQIRKKKNVLKSSHSLKLCSASLLSLCKHTHSHSAAHGPATLIPFVMLLHSAGFVRHQSNTQRLTGGLSWGRGGRLNTVQLSEEVWKEVVAVTLLHLLSPCLFSWFVLSDYSFWLRKVNVIVHIQKWSDLVFLTR